MVISRGELAREVLTNWTLSIRSHGFGSLTLPFRGSGGTEGGDRRQLHPENEISCFEGSTTKAGNSVSFENRCNSQV